MVRIGLEVHCQLTKLKSKLFCNCSSDYRGKGPNTNICPVCFGMPGSLPVLNEKALKYALMIALALNAKISERMLFYRKNYFYPDMPKNFQISQYDKAGGMPLATGGRLSLDDGKIINIRRIQLEEDTGKLSYDGTIESSSTTYIDYNRAGIALIEIVTEPDMNSPKEARLFLQKLSSILEHLGLCDPNLEGAIRCDANISFGGGRRVEIKNISSFKEVERALRFEITRQRNLVSKGIEVKSETRHWDDVRRVTFSLRVKEEEEDYRYFPEPDLVPIEISNEMIQQVLSEMPELPEARKRRFMDRYGLPSQTAEVLTSRKALADLFEKSIELYPNAREIANWLASDLLAYLADTNKEIESLNVKPDHFAELVRLIDDGVISRSLAKSIFIEMVSTGKMPSEIVKGKGLEKISDQDYILQVVDKVFKENERAVKDALMNEKAINYLMGCVMKESGGKIDPNVVLQIIRQRLDQIRSVR
ncbi:MAG: Asp-tRNA(Asn)/Glu-tRNA(Gln) amidotransferase subunit GatB [Nitrososphaerota archaeon]|nr:Asp-tRNA(Asn)/Glu-tRNA(Gln) amidotransferase subunit GatB [Nitrososphaerota archaeon]